MNDDMTRRVRALERQNRVLITLAVVALFAAVASCASRSAEPPRYDLLRVRALEIVDDNDVTQAVLKPGEEGAVLMLGDAEGAVRAGMVVTDAGPGLALSDPDGNERLLVSASNGGAGLYLYDREGRSRLDLGTGQTNGTGLLLMDEAGSPRAGIGLHDTQGPTVVLADGDGGVLAALP